MAAETPDQLDGETAHTAEPATELETGEKLSRSAEAEAYFSAKAEMDAAHERFRAASRAAAAANGEYESAYAKFKIAERVYLDKAEKELSDREVTSS